MKLLALDTATEACSAALAVDGEVRGRFEVAPREHARLLLPMVEALLAEAGLAPVDLDAVAFGRGPGSFTGLRIAAGVAQGIAWGADLSVAPVSTLAAIALGAMEDGQDRVAAAIDARMGEVYWGCYRGEGGLAVLEGEECVCPPEAVRVPDTGRWLGAGTGWGAHGEVLAAACGERLAGIRPEVLPDARHLLPFAERMLQEGRTVAPEQAVPVYLRDRVARKPGGG